MWLIKYLFFNEIPVPTPLVKLSFVLLPWNKDPECEPLPELLKTYVDLLPSPRSDIYEGFSTQSRLTTHRNLRVSKLIHHEWRSIFVLRYAKVFVYARSKTDLNVYRDRAQRPEADNHFQPTRPRGEALYEIICNDALLPLGMTLAAARQYVWRQCGLVKYYR